MNSHILSSGAYYSANIVSLRTYSYSYCKYSYLQYIHILFEFFYYNTITMCWIFLLNLTSLEFLCSISQVALILLSKVTWNKFQYLGTEFSFMNLRTLNDGVKALKSFAYSCSFFHHFRNIPVNKQFVFIDWNNIIIAVYKTFKLYLIVTWR